MISIMQKSNFLFDTDCKTKHNWIGGESEALDFEIDNIMQDQIAESEYNMTNTFDDFLDKIKRNTILSLNSSNKENVPNDTEQIEFRLSECMAEGKYRESITFKFDDDYLDSV